jgi:hypothetical protein
MYKICSKCKEDKLLSEFVKDKKRKDGYYPQCKICRKEHYKINKEQILAQHAEYREANKEQIAMQRAEHYVDNKNKIAAYKAEYYVINRERIVLQALDYRANNKDQRAEYRQTNRGRILEYKRTNKDKINALTAKRRAHKLNATPLWLTKRDFEQIAELYTCAQMFRLYTGQEYHVDHIVPLQGKNVCGLHVPWNLQVIPASENLSKGNKLSQD